MKMWATMQATVVLSSGEAEYSAAVKGASQALGFRAILEDLGIMDMNIECFCDSNAAIGIANRTGVGKVRHLAGHLLWLQEKARSKEVTISKVDGSRNPADLFTKYLDSAMFERCSAELGLLAEQGRADAAPALQ